MNPHDELVAMQKEDPASVKEIDITVSSTSIPDWSFPFKRLVPATMKAWVRWLTEVVVVQTLTEYLIIRSQDRVRTLRKGTKKRDPVTDKKLLLEVGRNFKPGTKTTVTVVTKEGATAFMEGCDDATFQEMYLKMQARAKEVEERLKAEAAKSTEPKTETENAA